MLRTLNGAQMSQEDFGGGKVDLSEQARDTGQGSKEELEAVAVDDWEYPRGRTRVNWWLRS